MHKFVIYFFCILGIFFNLEASDSINTFKLDQFKDVAIATDLEPDDILALGIIFKEANLIYARQEQKDYPIKLVLVGQSNSVIKKIRMENLISSYFELPAGVKVKVVAGKSTQDHFPFEQAELAQSSQETHNWGLKEFMANSDAPFIIQLKPVQELFEVSFEAELACKTSVLFYGSFNFRKTLQDADIFSSPFFDSVRGESFSVQLQLLMDHFANSFDTMGILETFSVFGKESTVYRGHPWTQELREMLEASQNPFLLKFKQYVGDWNAHLLNEELVEIQQNIQKVLMMLMQDTSNLNGFVHAVLFPDLLNTIEIISRLTVEWNENLFSLISQSTMQLINQYRELYPVLNKKLSNLFDQIEGGFKFAHLIKPASGLQFTLADVAVAYALVDQKGIFSMTPVKIKVNPKGYLEVEEDETSCVYYYGAINKSDFAKGLQEVLILNWNP